MKKGLKKGLIEGYTEELAELLQKIGQAGVVREVGERMQDYEEAGDLLYKIAVYSIAPG